MINGGLSKLKGHKMDKFGERMITLMSGVLISILGIGITLLIITNADAIAITIA